MRCNQFGKSIFYPFCVSFVLPCSYENIRKHSYSYANQDPQPVPKKFRSQNDQCLNFADPPENIFNSLKIPRKTEGLQTTSQISSSNDTISSVIPPPIPAFEDNPANFDKAAGETALDSLTRKLDKPSPKIVKQYYRCKECQLFLSSQSTLDAHLAGARHAKKVCKRNYNMIEFYSM